MLFTIQQFSFFIVECCLRECCSLVRLAPHTCTRGGHIDRDTAELSCRQRDLAFSFSGEYRYSTRYRTGTLVSLKFPPSLPRELSPRRARRRRGDEGVPFSSSPLLSGVRGLAFAIFAIFAATAGTVCPGALRLSSTRGERTPGAPRGLHTRQGPFIRRQGGGLPPRHNTGGARRIG
jgi:hypothetical protein